MNRIAFDLPGWLQAHAAAWVPSTDADLQMGHVIEASRLNVQHASGGPFAAGVFARNSGALVGLGVNLVTTQGLSILHAELVAMAVAQRATGSYDLGRADLGGHVLVTSTEPCAMCLGAVPWSGVSHVVCGATAADAEAIGFDEGAKPGHWVESLRRRGISVDTQVRRDAAAAVLRAYSSGGGAIYNAGGSSE